MRPLRLRGGERLRGISAGDQAALSRRQAARLHGVGRPLDARQHPARRVRPTGRERPRPGLLGAGLFKPQRYGELQGDRLSDADVVRLTHKKWEDGPTAGLGMCRASTDAPAGSRRVSGGPAGESQTKSKGALRP